MHFSTIPGSRYRLFLLSIILAFFQSSSRALSTATVSKSYDLIVIGGGSAGLTAAKFAATFGKSVVIVEKSRMGGDCTWMGCVPSKSIIASAKVAHHARTAANYGVSTGNVKVDMAAVRKRVMKIQERIYDEDDSPEAMKKLGIDTLIGKATFVSPTVLNIGSVDGGSLDEDESSNMMIEANQGVVVATGAMPKRSVDKIAGLDQVDYLTYEEIFDLDVLPSSMTVVGGGPIGSELAQAYARLGVKVTQVASILLPLEEPEISRALEEVFEEDGIVRVKGRMVSVEKEGKGQHKGICTLDNGSNMTVTGDLLLVATGRSPNVRGFGLEELGVQFNAKGGIETNDKLQTNVKSVYAAGDCTGDKQFTHYAGFQGAVAARNILLPFTDSGVMENVPAATFTSPEVSSVGLTEAAAEEAFGASKVGVAIQQMKHVDRAVCDGQEKGLIKVVYNKKNYQILGASIMSPAAAELISEIGVAMKAKLPFDQLATVVHSYPAYSIALQIMAGDLYYEKNLKLKPVLDLLKRIGL